MCLSVGVDVCCKTFFTSLLLLQFFSDSHETWHTRSMCQYAKSVEQILQILILKFLEFLKF